MPPLPETPTSPASPPTAPPAPPAAPRPVQTSFARSGAWGGALGGAAAGLLAGGLGNWIETLAFPAWGDVVRGGALGLGVGLAVGALTGALTGPVAGWLAGARAASRWPAFVTFVAGTAALVEASQHGPGSAAILFVLGVASLFVLCVVLRWLARRARVVGLVLLGWLAVCLVGEAYRQDHPRPVTALTTWPAEPVVQLRQAPLGEPLGRIAVHSWFVTFDPDERPQRWHRWDLWEDEVDGCTNRWGHVHEDLMSPDDDVGGGPRQVVAEWRGDEARALLATLARSGEYPYRDRYLAWPGPDCNTYAGWVIREAGVPGDLGPRAIGRDYRGLVGAGTTAGAGVQVETSVLGVKAGLRDGAELHFLGLTFGASVWPPALKTPLGRVGFEE
jgi:Protein of unknown function (DUF3750)